MTSRARSLAVLSLASLAAGSTAAAGADGSSTATAEVTIADCSAARAWAPSTPYAVGALVTFDGGTFQCVQAHTSQSDWTPTAVPALWAPVKCGSGGAGGGSSGGSGSTSGGGSSAGSGSGASCDPQAWVFMGNDANACNGHLGESCGWTADDEGQGYHCATTSWGTGCEPGGATCSGGASGSSGGSSSGGSSGSGSGSSSGGGATGGGAGTGTAPASLVFSPYKDTSISMNWNTNVITTSVSGAPVPLATDLTQAGGKTITLAFATGECGSENWGGVPGAAMASANVGPLQQAGVKYVLSTGGAAGSFTCGSDAGMTAFLDRWASSGLIGVDFDIEAGQSPGVINDLVQRIKSAHAAFPGLRFGLTLATLAVSQQGSSTARSLGGAAQDGFNVYGDETMAAVKSVLGFDGGAASWPGFVTVNLMTMDYGSASAGICVVSGATCQMGQSAIQAAYDLHDRWGVPYANIELTPMIGGNDASDEHFTLEDADAVASFAIANGLAGIHYWSYDRDADCAQGSASATCNTIGAGYAGARGYLKRFLGDGLR